MWCFDGGEWSSSAQQSLVRIFKNIRLRLGLFVCRHFYGFSGQAFPLQVMGFVGDDLSAYLSIRVAEKSLVANMLRNRLV